MTANAFRRIALSMPHALESEHMGHPDFRVKGKIFATLFCRGDDDYGMVKLKPGQQKAVVDEDPALFSPVPGAWGRQGCTQVQLKSVDRSCVSAVRRVVAAAWRNTAPAAWLADGPAGEL